MIEKVAKAIFDAMDVTDGLDASSADRYARAAIEAMREPSRDMILAAFENAPKNMDDMLHEDFAEAYIRAIDAALTSSPPTP